MNKKRYWILFLIIVVAFCCILASCGNKSCSHIYDHVCDTTCNECGAERTTTHTYDDDQDTTCNVCGETRNIFHEHVYDNLCDESCNACNELRTIEHTYTNSCDRVCNICKFERLIIHTYDNECDTICNICGEMRAINHVYDNEQDESCNICGDIRNVACIHVYDNSCDTSCNNCNELRTIEHTYTNQCDNICNVCTFERIVIHVYDNDCDEACNICDFQRNVLHTYSFSCSTICLICYQNRIPIVKHLYDNSCDQFCNVCNEQRNTSHIDNDNNAICDICQFQMQNTNEEKIDLFVEHFNNHLNSICDFKKENLISSNIKFSNINSSGSINVYIDEIVSISVYNNFKHYVYSDGSELFIVQTEQGEYSVSHYNGEYEIIDGVVYEQNVYNNPFPMLTRTDVFLNENGTFSISNDYMKTLYHTWFNSHIASTLTFGTYQFNYNILNYWLDYADFVTQFMCNEFGDIVFCNIVLKDDEKEYYNITFDDTELKTDINIIIDADIQANMHFVYNKGVNGNAEFNFEIVDFDGIHTLFLRTDITSNIVDFVSNIEIDTALKNAKDVFDKIVAMKNKYNHEFTANNTCKLVAYYDSTYNLYALFEYNNGKYYYAGTAFTLDDINVCIATVDENNSLTVVEHNSYENINEILTQKYTGYYTINDELNDIDIVLVYDSELNEYIIFVKTGEYFQYSGYIKEVPPEYIDSIPMGIIDLTNKTITV